MQRHLPLTKADSPTPPSAYYQTDMTTPQHYHQSILQPQTVVASQSLPHDLDMLQSQGAPFVNPQFSEPSYGYHHVLPSQGYPGRPNTSYMPPNPMRTGGQLYPSPAMDFTRHHQQLQTTNPMNVLDPRPPLRASHFRRPSETVPPRQSQLSISTGSASAPPTISLPGQVASVPAPPPTSATGGEAPFPPQMLPQLDLLFVAFLQKVLSDEHIRDSRGEALHHPLPPRKQSKMQSLPLTSWRQIKLRIQAFTAAFQEELSNSLAVGMNLPRHEVSVKRVREYLWTKDLIARYNPSGRKAKSRGSHVWCVEARRKSDDVRAEWEFRPWRRKIQVMRDSLVVFWGQHLKFPFKVWDPQVQYEGTTADDGD
jgi:hypothetical protein